MIILSSNKKVQEELVPIRCGGINPKSHQSGRESKPSFDSIDRDLCPVLQHALTKI
jgi:hypothetical protein